MRTPKLLVFTSSYPSFPGGSEGSFVEDLTVGMPETFDVRVLAPRIVPEAPMRELRGDVEIRRFSGRPLTGHGGIPERIKKNRFLIFFIPLFLCIEFVQLCRNICEFRPEVVHAHWLIPQGLLAVCARILLRRRFAVVGTAHGGDLRGCGFVKKTLLKFTLNRLTGVSAVSHHLRQQLVSIAPGCDPKVLPMGVDTTLFSPEKSVPDVRQRHHVAGPMLLIVGSLIKLKGIDVMLRAMPEILKRNPKCKLLLAGGGPCRKDLEALARSLEIAENVVFLGVLPHDQLPAYFAAADLVVLPSYSEGWPVCVMEALASGTLTVVSDLPVFLAEPRKETMFRIARRGDPAEFAGQINRLLADPAALRAMTPQLRAESERFDLRKIRAEYRELLQASIAATAPRQKKS